jgi:hypothetical protein
VLLHSSNQNTPSATPLMSGPLPCGDHWSCEDHRNRASCSSMASKAPSTTPHVHCQSHRHVGARVAYLKGPLSAHAVDQLVEDIRVTLARSSMRSWTISTLGDSTPTSPPQSDRSVRRVIALWSVMFALRRE